MRGALVFGVGLFSLIVSVAAEEVRPSWQTSLLAATKEEPLVADASWNGPDILMVGVKDNGRPRNGYAEYFCVLAYEHGFTPDDQFMVQVVDIASAAQEDFRLLGSHWCRVTK
jgi:hypothetical protein